MGKYNVDRERDLSGPTELLIHGVGGASPESLIEDEAVLVAGDDVSGFYRAKHVTRRDKNAPGHVHRTQADNRMATREAYTWGGLTSGGGFLTRLKKSLWVLLLPFALVNSAGWMAPPARESGASPDSRDDTFHPGSGGGRNRVIRLLGVWVTLVFALWLAAIFIDMAALQCGANSDCAAGHSWLKWLNWDWMQSIQGRPVALMAIGLVAPLLGLAALWRIGIVSQRSSEAQLYALTTAPEDDGEQTAENSSDARKQITGEGMTPTELARDDLWHAKYRVGALLRVHLAVAIAAIASVFAFTVAWLEDAAGDDNLLFLALAAVSLAFTVGVALWGTLPGGTRPRRMTWRLLWASLLLLGAVVAAGWASAQTFQELQPFLGGPADQIIEIRNHFNAAGVVVALLPIVALIAVLFAMVAMAPYPEKNRSRWGQLVSASLGVITGIPIVVGGALWLADFLDRYSPTQERCDTCAVAYEIDIPGYYGAGGVVLLIIGLVVLVLFLVYYAKLRSLRKKRDGLLRLSDEMWSEIEACGTGERARKRFPEELGRLSDDELRELWEAHEQFSKWSISLAGTRLAVQWGRNRGVRIGLIIVIVALALGLWAFADIVALAFGDDLGFQDRLTEWTWLVGLSKWAVLALFGVLIGLAYRSYRSDDTRRSVARVWDILTFWPRWFHPLAPPSYAASALPQLRTHLRRRHRLQWPPKPGEPDEDRVLISAHSQGTVLAVAAVARLDDQTRSRLALLTYGSPVRSLYGWFFPRFFGRAQMDLIAESLGGPAVAQPSDPPDQQYARWRNLRRCTDPIAGTIFTEGDARGNEDCFELAKNLPMQPDGSIRLNKVDWIVPDPFPEFAAAGDPMPPTKGHSNYDVDQPFDSARCELFEALGADLIEVGCKAEPPVVI